MLTQSRCCKLNFDFDLEIERIVRQLRNENKRGNTAEEHERRGDKEQPLVVEDNRTLMDFLAPPN